MINNNKKAAMELTMGTMVTIVLLVMVLILGGYFVNKIFFSAQSSIDVIDVAVKDEINKLFSNDDNKKIVILPPSRRINLEKGTRGEGFAFSIRNVETEAAKFSYQIEATETDCSSLSVEEANSYLALGKQGNVNIPAGSIMDNPILVTFNIPETAPPCSSKYTISLSRGQEIYGASVDLIATIKSD